MAPKHDTIPNRKDHKMQNSLGVAIVTYNATDVIRDCLESLVRAATTDGVALHITVVDNASTDGTADMLEDWAAGKGPSGISDDLPFEVTPVTRPLEGHRFQLVRAAFNTGFAGGVNAAVRDVLETSDVDRVWILNPDGIVPPGTPGVLAAEPDDFAMLGGRILYHSRPDIIQADGGVINRWTGVTKGINLFAKRAEATFPTSAQLDFVNGAHMIISRRFWEATGPMEEDYFLYYEEIDWAERRGALPLRAVEDALLYHRAGSSIGSAIIGRRASPMALYFMHRARHRFMRKMFPARWPAVWAYSLGKAGKIALTGDPSGAMALLRGAAEAAPPPLVMDRLTPEAAEKTLSPRALRRYRATKRPA